MNNKQQAGFTLVEIVLVLVIIGLLLGGILKGQELINSAKVKNLADQNSGVQAAYYGFIDRYRQIPGDWAILPAGQAIGVAIINGGNGNGRVDNTYVEAAGLWEQLARANFRLRGFALPTAVIAAEATYGNVVPINAFNAPLILTRNTGYTGVGLARLNLHLGRNIPVAIARELDIKVDDGLPNSGVLRMTNADGTNTNFDPLNFLATFAACTTVAAANAPGNAAGTAAATDIFDVYDDSQDCAQVFLY